MAIFDRQSRYVNPVLVPYAVQDVRGRTVSALPVPEAPVEVSAGLHIRRQGESLDQLAFTYLNDRHGYWRIVELNDAVLPDALAELERIKIPTPSR